MVWQFIKENRIVKFCNRARTHRCFSAFWFFLVGVLGMWLTPLIGAICTLIFISLGWVIVWDTIGLIKSKYYHLCISRIVPMIVCILIVLFYWNKYVALFPSTKQLEDKIDSVQNYSDVAKLEFDGLSLHVTPPLVYSTDLSKMLEGCFIKKGDECYPACSSDIEEKYKKVIEKFPKFPFSYYGLALCLRLKGDESWKYYAEKAIEIFRKTTSISGHDNQHDQALKYLRDLLNTDANKPIGK
jgi:hypothetical protein